LRAATIEIREALRGNDHAIILDVGTGLGDIPACIAGEAPAFGCSLVTIGVDEARSLLR